MNFQEKIGEKGISPVIGTILLIAITVIVAASIGVVVYGFDTGAGDTINANLSIQDINTGQNEFTVVHEGGDNIEDAFAYYPNTGENAFDDLKVSVEGVSLSYSDLDTVPNDNHFTVGEQFTIDSTDTIDFGKGNTIRVIYVPGDQILAETEA